MKVYELVGELLKLPAGLDVEVKMSTNAEIKIFEAVNQEALHLLLTTAHVTHICKLEDCDQSYVELHCEVR